MKETKRSNRFRLYFFIVLVCLHLFSTAKAFDGNEIKIKATYIYAFLKYISWDESYLKEQHKICVYEDKDIYNILSPLKNKTINNRKINVIQIDGVDKSLECTVVYIGKNNKKWKQGLKKESVHLNVLTISDVDSFISNGGGIELVRIGNVIKFKLNMSTLKDSNLVVSSKIIRLAVDVRWENEL